MTKQHIDISDHDYKILKEITKKYTPYFDFYVFGSRVQGKAKKYSDIDIAYKKKKTKSIALLKDELEESNMAITVDLVDLDEIDSDFLELIKSQMISLA
ncbi:MAG: nucleotidyltransferase domain-containing protein [Bacteriovoracaceae bacterium]|jgi:hypothetical protein|nr:nucleotidyltransferase domain-containing protein [Bacteriovoracaceae bacterium]|tara:strand:- start:310 stop:606 length:297 start_codon:yes stop_codon:yes gene_type:complete